MSDYTDTLNFIGADIYPEEADFRDQIEQVVSLFREFDEALDVYVSEHETTLLLEREGVNWQMLPVQDKVQRIRTCFHNAGMKTPRDMDKWWTQHRRPKRDTTIPLCIALGLSYAESLDFMRRVCLERGFDFHNPEELVLALTIRERWKFVQTEQVLAFAESIRKDLSDTQASACQAVYTRKIIAETEGIKTPEELQAYLEIHRNDFAANFITASEYIRRIWDEIAEKNGLAAWERAEGVCRGTREEERTVEGSVWDVYLQILGVDIARKELLTDRSLKLYLKDNVLLHPIAEACFPDKQGILLALRGEHISNERMRKLLILLGFYRFQMRRCFSAGDVNAYANPDDDVRCISFLNAMLTECGFDELYAGNPYDWAFLYAARMDLPLEAFRMIMQEIVLENG